LSKSTDPATGNRYNSILVIIDKLTKYLYIIAYTEKFNAEQLRYIILDRLIQYHNIPKGLISDRDKLFTFNYWKTLIPMLGTRLRMSTAYHPVTDSQTERTNQSLEQYLRHYINSTHSNWVSLLSMAQLALNKKVSNTTRVTPFFANYGKEPNLFGEERKHLAAQSVIERVATLKKVHNNITIMQTRSAKYQNKKTKNGTSAKGGG